MYLLVPSSSAECNVMPLMLKAATPVGAVSNTISSGSNVPEFEKLDCVRVYQLYDMQFANSSWTT